MQFATVGFKTENGIISVEATAENVEGKFKLHDKLYVRKSFALKGTIEQIQYQLYEMMMRRYTEDEQQPTPSF